MTPKTYQQSLEDRWDDILEMGYPLVKRLDMGLMSLVTGEPLAREVIEEDSDINKIYLVLETQYVDLFALQQLVASDLRFITASFKSITDFGYVWGLSTDLAQYVLTAKRDRTNEVMVKDIGRNTLARFEPGLEAYKTEDSDACLEIAASGDSIDSLCYGANTITQDLIEHEVDSDAAPYACAIEYLLDDVLHVLTIRDLERMADHAVNIGAQTLYMAENDPTFIF